MTKKEVELIILKELKDYIIPLSKQEYTLLEKNVRAEGCREPLTVWKNGRDLVLIDGHNRYKICTRHNIPFEIQKLHFDNIDDVKEWMVDHQLGRRNLTPDQMSYYRGVKYLSLKKKKGGYVNVLAKGQSEKKTSELLADQFYVSGSTVKRDAKFAEGLHIIQRTNPTLKIKILTGQVKVKKADIQVLSSAANPDQLAIKNEADLANKAKLIRQEFLEEVEGEVKRLAKEKLTKAQAQLKELDPPFLKAEDKLRKIKGMILNAVNRAITEQDVAAMRELKKLIDRLEDQLFG